jgi:hypothetical protein
MKETPRRRIAVTSSLNEISTDPRGSRVIDGGFVTPPVPYLHASGLKISKDDVNGFSSTADICFFGLERRGNGL